MLGAGAFEDRRQWGWCGLWGRSHSLGSLGSAEDPRVAAQWRTVGTAWSQCHSASFSLLALGPMYKSDLLPGRCLWLLLLSAWYPWLGSAPFPLLWPIHSPWAHSLHHFVPSSGLFHMIITPMTIALSVPLFLSSFSFHDTIRKGGAGPCWGTLPSFHALGCSKLHTHTDCQGKRRSQPEEDCWNRLMHACLLAWVTGVGVTYFYSLCVL